MLSLHFGKCDLLGKKGACGIDARAQQSRMVPIASCIGTAAHGGHCRHLLEYLIDKKGENFPIDMESSIDIEAPIMRNVIGKKPETLGDLRETMDYVEKQSLHLLSAATQDRNGITKISSQRCFTQFDGSLCNGGWGHSPDSGHGHPKGSEDAPLVELGLRTIDIEKPVILCIGHNVAPEAGIMDYLEMRGLKKMLRFAEYAVQQDITRYNRSAKVVGPLSKQLKFI